uniref:Ribonucleoside-diphosphate reductase n=1 Tax=Cyprinid herpesvirus 2 TaxID=317878 RepID=A0A6H0QXG8_CYHV2
MESITTTTVGCEPYVVKRSGQTQAIDIQKVADRIENCGYSSKIVNPLQVAKKVEAGIGNGFKTSAIDVLLAQTLASMTTVHPDYGILASRIAVSNLHKQTPDTFSDAMWQLYHNVNPDTKENAPLVSERFFELSVKHKSELDAAVVHGRDFDLNYFGFKTLEKSYLLSSSKGPVERPQYMYMRCAMQIHGDNIARVVETYDLMSRGYFTHASPTLFNACSTKSQMSSCFLLNVKEDSMEGIMDTLKSCAMISKHAGGIGMSASNLRAGGAYIKGTNGRSNGLVPTLRIFNALERMVDQGGNKRPGALAVYLEPWHADIFEFLDLRKNNGVEEQRTRDLFQTLWIPDLFMQRVKDNKHWSLMCPARCPGLDEAYGEKFDMLYTGYEKTEGAVKRTVSARELWDKILVAQLETGGPFMLYKDAANRKSNHNHLGTIKCSNLCTEIIQYTNKDEVAVCNLASVALNAFVEPLHDGGELVFNHQKLTEVVKVITLNLNNLIDVNFYPVPEAAASNRRHRPIGIGVQGLADVFQMLRMPFTSPEAKRLNKMIFETIYHAALTQSCAQAELYGPYESYDGSPVSKGLLQFDMWGLSERDLGGHCDWNTLRKSINRFGLRNSLLVAPMPTASTAQILGNNESIEPFTSNLYQRRVLSGDFQVVNKHMVKVLEERGLWTDEMRTELLVNKGSVQAIASFPSELKDVFKTAYELPQKDLIDMAADRAPFVDQSQSLNLFLCENDPDLKMKKLTRMHMHAWSRGLKTGMYYLRTKAAVAPVQFSVAPEVAAAASKRKRDASDTNNGTKSPKKQSTAAALEIVCTDDVCVMCSS